MTQRMRIAALALALALPGAGLAEDYLGLLRLPRTGAGHNYSPYFGVSSDFVDYARPLDPFTSPANLASNFRAPGFGVDATATLPLWRFSFYGRMGAYRGDVRDPFVASHTSLLGDASMRSRWRYGLGMRYDFTRSLGVRAELEHYSPLGAPLAADPDSDQFTVGLSWRF
jgi:hypothetical protein